MKNKAKSRCKRRLNLHFCWLRHLGLLYSRPKPSSKRFSRFHQTGFRFNNSTALNRKILNRFRFCLANRLRRKSLDGNQTVDTITEVKNPCIMKKFISWLKFKVLDLHSHRRWRQLVNDNNATCTRNAPCTRLDCDDAVFPSIRSWQSCSKWTHYSWHYKTTWTPALLTPSAVCRKRRKEGQVASFVKVTLWIYIVTQKSFHL